MLRVLLALASFALLATGSVEAQTVVVQQRSGVPEQKNAIRAQVSFFVPGAVNSSEASMKAQEQARRSLYESAAHECDVLRAVLASECRLEIARGEHQSHVRPAAERRLHCHRQFHL